LEGSEGEWSLWNGETRKDYTNLPEHRYQFRVRARNAHGQISPEAVYGFRILPPWYRTWWAYTLYAAIFLLTAWLGVHWRLKTLEAQNVKLERLVEERTIEVRTERDQNEALLLNILPAAVASELRNSGSVTPMAFEDVTVCFGDFKEFTVSSEKLPAAELVTTLNEYFTAFDRIMDRYGLEKLKTIGDSYMFVSGLPERCSSHALDAVLAGFEMVKVVGELARPAQGRDWKMRVGLYSGPVVAGVVGKRKFAFDIWGSTVNLASRMETNSAANKVNVSATTQKQICDFIDCEPRGLIRIKDGRDFEMYFARGLRPELLRGPISDGMPLRFRDSYEAAFGHPPRAFPEFLLVPETAAAV
jgi:class 3 adenylate cyclase